MHLHWSVLQCLFLTIVHPHIITALFVTSLADTFWLVLVRHLQNIQCRETTAIKNHPSLLWFKVFNLQVVITQAQRTVCCVHVSVLLTENKPTGGKVFISL
jgi:hypothetical protein